MNKTTAARFDFFSASGAESADGSFIVRPTEMVLEVESDDGVYLAKGKRHKSDNLCRSARERDVAVDSGSVPAWPC